MLRVVALALRAVRLWSGEVRLLARWRGMAVVVGMIVRNFTIVPILTILRVMEGPKLVINREASEVVRPFAGCNYAALVQPQPATDQAIPLGFRHGSPVERQVANTGDVARGGADREAARQPFADHTFRPLLFLEFR